MKKILTAIVAVLYLFTSTGATLHLHYCMGELAQWNLGNQDAGVCPGCGMDKKESEKKGCCKDEARFLKNTNDQKAVESAFQLLVITGTVLIPAYMVLPEVHISSLTEEKPVSNPPPLNPGVAVYLLNRTFLI